MMRVHQNILTMGLNENSRVGEPIRSAVRGSARSIVFRGWTLEMVAVMVRAVVQAVSVTHRAFGMYPLGQGPDSAKHCARRSKYIRK